MFYNGIMNIKKALLILAVFFFLPAVLISQANYRGQRVQETSADGEVLSAQAKRVDGGIQIDVYFSTAVNPVTFAGKNVLVNSKALSSGVKTVFNREGTQVRFVVKETFPIELKIQGLQTTGGKSIPPKKITLNK